MKPLDRKKVRKRLLHIYWLLLFLVVPLSARKIATFRDHIMPDTIRIDDSRIYITEGSGIFIYSLKDYKLQKKFGSRGEGPEEFKGKPQVDVQGSHILVNSPAKVSFFTKDGIFIREVNAIVSGRNFQALGERYVGYNTVVDKNGVRYSGIYIYDSSFVEVKSVFRYESISQSHKGRGWNLFSKTYIKPLVCDDKIVVAGGTGFIIEVFDDGGRKLFSIKREYSRVRFTRAHGEKVLNLYKTRPSTAPDYDWWRKNIHFPDAFPAIRTLFAADKKIYVRTYREEKGRSEFFVFDARGRLLKKVFLPIAPSSAKNAYPYLYDSSPFTIKSGNLYQLILDEETEEWSLHVREI